MTAGLAVLVLGELLVLRSGDQESQNASPTESGLAQSAVTAQTAMKKAEPFALGSARPSDALPATAPLAPPDPEIYASQASANPHETPAVLKQFASRMAARMEPALASEAQARKLFPELRECALQDGGVESVRAICAVNAGRLAEKFQEALGEDYKLLRERLPKEILHSVQSSGF